MKIHHHQPTISNHITTNQSHHHQLTINSSPTHHIIPGDPKVPTVPKGSLGSQGRHRGIYGRGLLLDARRQQLERGDAPPVEPLRLRRQRQGAEPWEGHSLTAMAMMVWLVMGLVKLPMASCHGENEGENDGENDGLIGE